MTVRRAFAKRGVAVPRAMSVTGFDDDPIAEWGSPALTSVSQAFAEMGRRALALLAERLVAGSAPRHEAVPVSLVRRFRGAPPP